MSDESVTSYREGHAACPFVAFEDDRDHRAESPDFRHRCFASAEPEPRALPHQERFCLSAAFAACPIFLDWARQEAAGVTPRNGAAVAEEAAPPRAPVKVTAESATPAFLASRGRTVPAEATSVAPHSADPGSGLWGFEGAPKRTVASASSRASGSASPNTSSPAYSMARREPTRPDWENPPRMDKYPRLRARPDRENNQPLLFVAVGVAALIILLLYIGLPSGGGGGGGGGGGTPTSHLAGGSLSPTPTATPTPTPAPERTLMLYQVSNRDKNLTQIAAKFGVSLTLLEAANPLSQFPSHDYNVIYPGMTIYIPWQTWTPPAPTPTPPPTPVPTPSPTISAP